MELDAPAPPPPVPRATCRLQLSQRFTFRQAAEIVDYLHALGVSHVYLSPFLAARPGSVHGYDVVDHGRINPEIGTLQDLEDLAARLHAHSMGIIMDVVPNHMCIAGADNAWWRDVLENGPSSAHAAFFDIDWQPLKPELTNQVLLPVLGDQFGRVLENGELSLSYERGAFWVHYWDNRWPLAPRSLFALLEPVLEGLRAKQGDGDAQVMELESILTALRHLPAREDTHPEHVRERVRENEVIKRRLDALVTAAPRLAGLLQDRLTTVNGKPGDPRSFDTLESILQQQAYRLSFWKVASDEINYRRFFDINELAALHVENPAVFAAVHAVVLDLLRRGIVNGLRIDHVDGLHDPQQYLEDLQRLAQEAVAAGRAERGEPPAPAHCFLVVEKIVVGNESLRAGWPVDGTTGYGFLNHLNGVLVDGSRRQAFLRLYERFTGVDRAFEDVLYESKRLILNVSMSSELSVLARQLDLISEQHRFSRDFTLNSLHLALAEFIAAFPAYRTYVRAHGGVDPSDRALIQQAVHVAKRRNPGVSASIFDFLASVLLEDVPQGINDEHRAARRQFTMHLQQLTGPVMAKGMEDTAFYRYYPLAALNEVGGTPARFGLTVEEFHHRCQARLQAWPHCLSATSTHDTKRSEDVRARLDVLSEIPQDWYAAISRWRDFNRRAKTEVHGLDAPGPNEEYLLYQTLLGAWPVAPMDPPAREVFTTRIQEYFLKAAREAKVHTSWVSPDDEYEQACAGFIARVLDPDLSRPFLADLAMFQAPLARAGMLNSLAQVLLKGVAPGVPDLFQGMELPTFTLVDPDNRQPVDFARRRALLEVLDQEAARGKPALLERLRQEPQDGALKLFLTATVLRLRARHPELFNQGDYVPLRVQGDRADHVVAMARRHQGSVVVAVTGRLFCRLDRTARRVTGPRAWGETVLLFPEDLRNLPLVDVLTDRPAEWTRVGRSGGVKLGRLFSLLPLALLES